MKIIKEESHCSARSYTKGDNWVSVPAVWGYAHNSDASMTSGLIALIIPEEQIATRWRHCPLSHSTECPFDSQLFQTPEQTPLFLDMFFHLCVNWDFL